MVDEDKENGEVEPTWQMEGVSKGPWALTRHIMHWEEAYRMGTNQDGPSEPHINLFNAPGYSKLWPPDISQAYLVVLLSYF